MPKMQRDKGAAFERWVVRFFKSLGLDATRMAPMQAGHRRHADVETERKGVPAYSVECKHQRAVPEYFYNCLAQAEEGPGVPVVIAKGHRKRPIVVMYLDDWNP